MRTVALTTLLALAAVGCETEKSGEALSSETESSSKVRLSEAEIAGDIASVMFAGGERGSAPLGVGQVVQGTLAAGDFTTTSGAYFDSWVFTLGEPADVTIAMSSDDFDTYVAVYEGPLGTLGTFMGKNDDGGDGTDSRIELSLGQGTYSAVAYSFVAEATGDYELTMSMAGGDQVIKDGWTTEGTLSSSDGTLLDGRYYQDWYYTGSAGEIVTFDLGSTDFDTYLYVRRDGEQLAANDDDPSVSGTRNSSITMTLPAHGAYTLRLSSYAVGQVGDYTLSASSIGARPSFSGFSTGGDPSDKYALIVGIDHYARAGDLIGPIIDSRTMERVLTDKFDFDPDNVVTLNDSDATRANIAQGIVQHLGQAGPDGIAVFFFAGHGAQLGVNVGLKEPLDPEPAGVGDQGIVVYGYDDLATLMLDEELGYLIESIDAGRKLVVVDACHSGEITRGTGQAQVRELDLTDSRLEGAVAIPTDFITSDLRALRLDDTSWGFGGDFSQMAKAFQRPMSHLQWGASEEEQVSWTRSDGDGGVFTHELGDALMNASGTETFAEIHEIVHAASESETAGSAYTAIQSPQMRGAFQNMTLNDFFRRR